MNKLITTVLLGCSLIATRATQFTYNVNLDGPSEPSTSLGTGFGSVIYDNIAHTLKLQVTFSGLVQTGTGTTLSHIHAATTTALTGTAGVATTSTSPGFAGFPVGQTSGSYNNTLDMTLAGSWNASYITANGGTTATAEAALAAAMASGKAYWNIHSSTFPGGEIRGFLIAVPEPTTWALLGLGLTGLIGSAWCRGRRKGAQSLG